MIKYYYNQQIIYKHNLIYNKMMINKLLNKLKKRNKLELIN